MRKETEAEAGLGNRRQGPPSGDRFGGAAIPGFPWPLSRWTSLLLVAIFAQVSVFAETEDAVLTRVAEIRGLTLTKAEQALPVRLRGVVIWHSTAKPGSLVVHDGEQSIWVEVTAPPVDGVWPGGNLRPEDCKVGVAVEMEGLTDPGGYAPRVLARRIAKVGVGPVPPARSVTIEDLRTGAYDAQRVELVGIVWRMDPPSPDEGNMFLVLALGDERCATWIEWNFADSPPPPDLVDARVRIRGICVPTPNMRGELVGFRLQVADIDDVTVLTPPPANPFAAPHVTLDRLLPFSPEGNTGHRKVTQGIVSFSAADEFFCLQEGVTGVRVEARGESVRPGDRVEVAGFLERSGWSASITGALVRRLGRGPVPEAHPVTVGQILNPDFLWSFQKRIQEGDYDHRLVRIRGVLRQIGANNQPGNATLLVESEGRSFSATMPVRTEEDERILRSWIDGSEVELTGVCELILPTRLPSNPSAFRLWLESPHGVKILRPPSWWTARRLWAALGLTLLVLAGATVWISALHRAVRRHAKRLEQLMRSHRDVELEYTSAQRERLRLAVDLHDGIKQHLAAASFRVDAAAGHLPDSPAVAAAQLETAHNTLLRTQTELEECLWGLHAVAEGPPDFVALLQHVTARAEHWPKDAVVVESTGAPRHLSRDVVGGLLLLFQEATGNAFRHGHATRVTVHVHYGVDALELRIADNGSGFDPRNVPGPRSGHFGIEGMKQRMHWLRGTLDIARRPEGGMEILSRLPWRALQSADPADA